MKTITLMTDFGLRDGYAGVMHGVIYRISPDAQITDLTHTIPPQNIRQGELVWSRACAYFPEGTVHVGVVDPGVGTSRRPIAARLGKYFFVCPDNGLITLLLEAAEQAGDPVEIVHLDQPRYWLPQISSVFHGRDIFSPVAAHLANGAALSSLGRLISDPVRLPLPEPQQTQAGWRGEVIEVDSFGNLGTNFTRRQLEGLKNVRVRLAGREIRGLSETFGDRAPGELVALIDSSERLAVSVVNGSAAREIGVEPGEVVEVVTAAEAGEA